jgi:hypothetical protein
MSDVVRNFSMGGNLRKRRRDLRRRAAGRIGRGVLFLALVALVAVLWMSRDNYDMGALIPKDRSFQACVVDVMRKQEMLGASRLWQLLPEGDATRAGFDRVSANPPLPKWLLNNLSTGTSHWSSSRPDNFEDILVVTRMTRIGCLAEKVLHFLPMIKADNAGGLRLRHVPEASLFYAVRGRVLLASPSRRILAHALTLDADEAAGPAALAEWSSAAAGADLYGRIDPAAVPELKGTFDAVQFSLWMEPASIRASVKAKVGEVWKQRFAGLLDGTTPRDLRVAPEGCVMLSADFGKPVGETLLQLARAFGQEDKAALLLGVGALSGSPEYAPAMALLQGVLNGASGGLRLSWTGVDVNEMMPVPILAGSVDGGVDAVMALIQAPPAVPAEIPAIDAVPRIDAEKKLVYLPMVGGPSIKPSFAVQNDGVLFSTSLAKATDMLAAPPAGTLESKGNLYLCVRPGPAAQAVVDMGRELAEFHLVRGQTAESFLAAARPWLDSAGRVEELSLLAACENGELRADARLTMP